jgi:Concanavalin A-like lectin/glucanases superfamily
MEAPRSEGLLLYIDGTQQTTSTGSNTLSASILNGTSFQTTAAGSQNLFQGYLDEVMAYNRVLTRVEMRTLYRLGWLRRRHLDGGTNYLDALDSIAYWHLGLADY